MSSAGLLAIAGGLFFLGFHGGIAPHSVNHITPATHIVAQVHASWHLGVAKPPSTPAPLLQQTYHHLLSGMHALGSGSSGPLAAVSAGLASASVAYQGALVDHYSATTAAQALILVGLGDVGAQLSELSAAPAAAPAGGPAESAVAVEPPVTTTSAPGAGSTAAAGSPASFDWLRTLRMALLGLLIGGVGTSHWLAFLEAQLPGHGSAAVVVEKALLDACVWAPVANTAYLVLTPVLEGQGLAEVQALLSNQFAPVMRTELMTFFPYNLVSFSVIPPLFRPFTTGFVSMCFALYISIAAHSGAPKAAAIAAPVDTG